MSEWKPRKCTSCGAVAEAVEGVRFFVCPFCKTAHDLVRQSDGSEVLVEASEAVRRVLSRTEYLEADAVKRELSDLIAEEESQLEAGWSRLETLRAQERQAFDQAESDVRRYKGYAVVCAVVSIASLYLASTDPSSAGCLFMWALIGAVGALFSVRFWLQLRGSAPAAIQQVSQAVRVQEKECAALETELAQARLHLDLRRTQTRNYVRRSMARSSKTLNPD